MNNIGLDPRRFNRKNLDDLLSQSPEKFILPTLIAVYNTVLQKMKTQRNDDSDQRGSENYDHFLARFCIYPKEYFSTLGKFVQEKYVKSARIILEAAGYIITEYFEPEQKISPTGKEIIVRGKIRCFDPILKNNLLWRVMKDFLKNQGGDEIERMWMEKYQPQTLENKLI